MATYEDMLSPITTDQYKKENAVEISLNPILVENSTPLDVKSTPVATYAELGRLPMRYRYVGLTVTVLSDENSDGEMTEYWLKGGKSNKYWTKKNPKAVIDFGVESGEES